MLLIFTFSITPKKYWHDLFADHTDYYSLTKGEQASVSKNGVNCHCDDLVVSSPFVKAESEAGKHLPICYKEFHPVLYQFLDYPSNAIKDLRGPPGNA